MTGVLSTVQRRLLAIFVIAAALFGATAVVTAPAAQAANGMTADCSIRASKQIYVYANGVKRNVGCGGTYGTTAANGITSVTVVDLPFCVYFGSTLAGCGSPGVYKDVSNRSGQTGRVVPQNPNSR